MLSNCIEKCLVLPFTSSSRSCYQRLCSYEHRSCTSRPLSVAAGSSGSSRLMNFGWRIAKDSWVRNNNKNSFIYKYFRDGGDKFFIYTCRGPRFGARDISNVNPNAVSTAWAISATRKVCVCFVFSSVTLFFHRLPKTVAGFRFPDLPLAHSVTGSIKTLIHVEISVASRVIIRQVRHYVFILFFPFCLAENFFVSFPKFTSPRFNRSFYLHLRTDNTGSVSVVCFPLDKTYLSVNRARHKRQRVFNQFFFQASLMDKTREWRFRREKQFKMFVSVKINPKNQTLNDKTCVRAFAMQ